MKKSSLSLVAGLVLALIFGLRMICFQVRVTEVALLTTFGKPTAPYTEPGLKFKMPWPIQDVLKFDNRVQNFEDRFEETPTSDGYNLLVSVYAGWRIKDPTKFREAFVDGSMSRARTTLEERFRSAKNARVGKHPFSDFVSTDPQQLKFAQIETEILAFVRKDIQERYGMEIVFLGIKRLGLPESVTQKVFERMTEERQRVTQKLQANGERESINIRSAADRDRARILADAEAKATGIRGAADAEAAQYYASFEKNPELAILLQKLAALEASLKDRATLVVDPNTPPFDLLDPKNKLGGSTRK
jgi:modulator of FtsH protease HflC